MNKQMLLFANCESEDNQKYTKKVNAPIYKPSHTKPHLITLCDSTKTKQLIREIDQSDLVEEEKAFLRTAAWRHAVFHYERIADYYAHAAPGMQRLIERSALVIIDFDSAIEQGYVRLCDEIHRQYLEEYNGNPEPTT